MVSRSAAVLCALQALVGLTACQGASEREQARAAPTRPVQVYLSNDSGRSWQPAALGLPADDNGGPSISDLAAAERSFVLATKRDGIFLFDSATNRWRPIATPIATTDVDAVAFHRGALFAGTHGSGAWRSLDGGKTWQQHSDGLDDTTVRKLVAAEGELYAGTNGGLFRLSDASARWEHVFGDASLQVNGLAAEGGYIYLASQRGAYRSDPELGWKLVLADRSLHNIAVAHGRVYAMVYSELFVSSDRGDSWQSAQAGMPAGMYTFQVGATPEATLAGQWDSVYRMTDKGWQRTGSGLPQPFPVTELVTSQGRVVVASSTRRDRNP